MKNSFNAQSFMFMSTLVFSIIVSISSDSILGIWMGMEMNLFSIVSIMTMKEKDSEKSTMTYFLIQSAASMIFLFSSIMIEMTEKSMKLFFFSTMYISLLIKLGMTPFLLWFISVMENLSWKICFLLLTVQKIIPITIMSMINQQKILLILVVLNSVIASVMGLSTFSMRKILSISSVNHISFLLIAITISKKLFKIYFLIYSLMNFMGTKIFNELKINFLSQVFFVMKSNKMMSFNMILIFMSMAGLPPLMGFMPKIMVLMKMIQMSMISSAALILISSTISTFFYLRLCFMNFINNLNEQKKNWNKSVSILPMLSMFTPFAMLMWNFKLNKL